MIDAILSAEEFRTKLNISDVFWHMASRYGKPYAVEGPCTILELSIDEVFGCPLIMYACLQESEVCIIEDSINDLTNEYHGVFLNEADAFAYFEERKRASVEDPYFVARIQRQKTERGVRI